jgi:hypothetical protein
MKCRPVVVTVIAILISLTLFRVQTLLLLPTLTRFGGTAPDAWLVPWVSDSLFGLLVPVIVILLLRRTTLRIWGALVAYNALGAFDYSIGLATQWQQPLPAEMASPPMVFGGIGLFMLFQLIALGLLFRATAIRHFNPFKTT